MMALHLHKAFELFHDLSFALAHDAGHVLHLRHVSLKFSMSYTRTNTDRVINIMMVSIITITTIIIMFIITVITIITIAVIISIITVIMHITFVSENSALP